MFNYDLTYFKYFVSVCTLLSWCFFIIIVALYYLYICLSTFIYVYILYLYHHRVIILMEMNWFSVIQWSLSEQNLLVSSFCVRFIQMKLTKIITKAGKWAVMYLCVSFCMILIFDLGIVLTVVFFLFFSSYSYIGTFFKVRFNQDSSLFRILV